MADLTELQAAGVSKIIGSDSTGIETNPMAVSVNGDANVADGLSGTGLFGNLSVPTANTAVEVKVGAAKLTNRKSVTFHALDGNFFWGYTSSVTSANGTPIKKNSFTQWACDPTATTPLQIWVVSVTSSVNGRISEAL